MRALPPFLFIVGRGRSGTTLLRAMFDSHPHIAIPSESHFIVPLGRQRRRYERPGGFETDLFVRDLTEHPALRLWQWGAWGLSNEDLARALAAAPPTDLPDAMRKVFAAYARSQGKARYGDKTPINVLHIPFLARLFPESRFIHLIRDGRNVALSYLSLEFGPGVVWEAAISWKRFVTAGRTAGHRLGPQRYREVRYEDLIEHPEEHLRQLCSFVELEFDDRMLRYFERAGAIVGSRASDLHIHSPITKGLRDWRSEMSANDVELFEALAGDLLADLHYERAMRVIPLRTHVLARRRWVEMQLTRMIRRLRGARESIAPAAPTTEAFSTGDGGEEGRLP